MKGSLTLSLNDAPTAKKKVNMGSVEELIDNLDDEDMKTVWRKVSTLTGTEKGFKIPILRYDQLKERIDTAKIKGKKLIVICFWSRCPACKRLIANPNFSNAIRDIQSEQAKKDERELDVVAIDYLGSKGNNGTLLFERHGVRSYPTILLIGKNIVNNEGKKISCHYRWSDRSSANSLLSNFKVCEKSFDITANIYG